MAQQQMQLQVATMQSNAQQLAYLTNHMGNLGTEVGKVIASHPTHHTIQATLSHPNAMPGQSNDPGQLRSLTRAHPVGMSVPRFNYGPYAQAFQPQPNDKNTQHIDEATHQIVQRHLPPSVKVRYDATHTFGTATSINEFIDGFCFVVETRLNGGHWVTRLCFWHSTFRTSCVTSSGFMLQPNTQEREFGRYAPTLDGLDPLKLCQFYCDLCRVGHDCRIYLPACEDFQPEDTFSVIECGDTQTARLPKFCQSQAPRWEAIIHHHLKRDKVIPSLHPQLTEIRHNPNGFKALMLLVSPHHPAFTDNGIFIQPHPQQGKCTLNEHFRHCKFYYHCQQCYLNAKHNWMDDIHIIHFLDSC